MKCYNCKAIITDGASFCPKCGKPQVISQNLIDDAIDGSQSALTDLYNRTYSTVYNTIKFMVKDEDTVLDLLQDSYVKAFASLEQLQEAGKFVPWIKRIAHNRTVDYLRSAKPVFFSEMVSDDSETALEFEDDRPENLPEVVMDRRETARLINEILDSLPDDQRACISLFYYDQLSTKEIAAELEIPEATVKSRLQYGRKKIEMQVRNLEKKGTKLYSLAPIVFFMLLFRQQAQALHVPSSAVLKGVLTGMSAGQTAAAGTVTAKAAGAAVKAAAKHTAFHAAKTAVTTKIIAAVAAAAVVGGSITVIHHTQQSQAEPAAIVSSLPETSSSLPMPEEPSVVLSSPEDDPSAPYEQADQAAENEPLENESELPEETEPESAPEESPAPVTAAETPPPAIFGSWSEAYQTILNEYQTCLSEGAGGSSPCLQYEMVRYALEVQDGTRSIMYGLYDVNGDDIPELVLAMNEMYSDRIPWYTPFEIYAFNGTAAVPVFAGILEDNESLHIGVNGVLWTDSGNSGFSPTSFYELPKGSSEVKETAFFDTIHAESGSDYYQHIVNGITEGTVSRDEFRSEWIPEDADIEYQSILNSVPSSWGSSASEAPALNKLDTDYIGSLLGIPEDLQTEVRFIDVSYWEAGEMWLAGIEFYHDGILAASAQVNAETGEPVKNIMMYGG